MTRPTARRMPWEVAEDDSVYIAPAVLPPGHFLSNSNFVEARVQIDEPVIAESAWNARARPDTSSLAAADYDVSVQTGFIPPEEPLQRLQVDDDWIALELCLDRAQHTVKQLSGGGVGRMPDDWRAQVLALPQPTLRHVTTLPQLRRAHVVLSFLSHFYIHSTFPSQSTVPPQLAVPWVQVSDRLGVPPVLNYADTTLWNWRMLDPARGLRFDNITITTTFTDSASERAFFLLSLFCEMHGPAILRLMSATLDESFFADRVALGRISAYLLQIASCIDELTKLMHDATKGSFGHPDQARIIPEVFYWEIRPWFNGGKWLYEGVCSQDGTSQSTEMEWGGPSAGQSSLVHAIDLFLGVDHSPRPPRPATSSRDSIVHSSTASMDPSGPLPPASSAAVLKSNPTPVALSDATFMARMSTYMPSFHRAFLHHLASLHTPTLSNPSPIPSLRTLAVLHPTELQASYDRAVKSMKLFRDEHMRLATVFIVSQARREPGRDTVFWAGWDEQRRKRDAQADRDKMKGTGGTDLVTFLKLCRDRTTEAFIDRP